MAVSFVTYKAGETAKIKILKPTVCDGHDVNPGDLVEAGKGTALELIYSGKAEKYVEPVVEEKAVEVPKTKKGK